MFDPKSYALLTVNLDLPPDKCLGVMMFHVHLTGMAAKVGTS